MGVTRTSVSIMWTNTNARLKMTELKTLKDIIVRFPIGKENAFHREFEARLEYEEDLERQLRQEAIKWIKEIERAENNGQRLSIPYKNREPDFSNIILGENIAKIPPKLVWDRLQLSKETKNFLLYFFNITEEDLK